MKTNIKAAAVQFSIAFGDVDSNLSYVRELLPRLSRQGVELAVLPEFWSAGFAYRQLKQIATRTPEIVAELQTMSSELCMVIVGSLPESHGDKVFNTSYLIDSGAIIGRYRKIHLFSLMGEDKAIDSGESSLVVETSLGKIGVMICYDLRFPELARKLALDGSEIIVVSGEWPKPREEHWTTLLRARAIENQLYVVAANCCGVVGNLDFFGLSLIINPKGEILSQGGYENCEPTAILDSAQIESWRESITCFKDRKPDCY